MILELIKQWDKNKHRLEEYFRTTNQEEYSSYEQIVIKIFELCLQEYDGRTRFDLTKMTVVDDGYYQGTQIFIIPKDVYQPDASDYLVTNTYYGSCSGCDTLQSIHCYTEKLPREEQVRDYMALSLHLVQKLRWLDGHETLI